MRGGEQVAEELAGVDEVALGAGGIVFDFRADHAIGQVSVVDALVTAFHVAGKIFTDEAVEQGTEDVLLEVPSIDGTADVIGDLPDAALEFGALGGGGHGVGKGFRWRCARARGQSDSFGNLNEIEKRANLKLKWWEMNKLLVFDRS